MEEKAETSVPFDRLHESHPTAKEALAELIALLESYSPVWYTEEHHNRAMSALQHADK